MYNGLYVVLILNKYIKQSHLLQKGAWSKLDYDFKKEIVLTLPQHLKLFAINGMQKTEEGYYNYLLARLPNVKLATIELLAKDMKDISPELELLPPVGKYN